MNAKRSISDREKIEARIYALELAHKLTHPSVITYNHIEAELADCYQEYMVMYARNQQGTYIVPSRMNN